MSLKTMLLEIRTGREDASTYLKVETLKELKLYRDRLRYWSIFAYISSLLLIVTLLPIALLWGSDPATLLASGGSVSATLAALITYSVYAQKNWRSTDLLLIFIEEATEEQVSSIVDKLIERL